MTSLLDQAFARASELSADEQDALARWILLEIEQERRWTELFDTTPDALDALASEALSEHHAARSKPLDLSKL
jgi:hypothetical protein